MNTAKPTLPTAYEVAQPARAIPRAAMKKAATKNDNPFKPKLNTQEKAHLKKQTAKVIETRSAGDAAGRALNTIWKMACDDDGEVAGYATSVLYRLLSNACGNFEYILTQTTSGEVEEGQPSQEIKLDGTWVEDAEPGNRERIKRIREMFSKEEALPVPYHVHRDKRDDLAETVRRLGLGSAVDLNYEGGKRYSTRTPANQVAEMIFRFAEPWRGNIGRGFIGSQFSEEENEKINTWGREYAAQLPKLSRNPESLKKWQDAALKFIPLYFGEEFQEHPYLAQLVKTQEKAGGRNQEKTVGGKLVKTQKKAGGRKTQLGKPARYAMRKAVKDAVKKAFLSIAKVGENKA